MNRLPSFFKTLKQPPLYLFWSLVIFFITLFLFSLFYFGFINFRARPAAPLTQDAGLPISVSDPVVKTASVFYTLGGKIAEVNLKENGTVEVKLESRSGEAYPRVFTIFLAQAIFSQKDTNFSGDPVSELKKGKQIEFLLTVDLKSGQETVTQVFLD